MIITQPIEWHDITEDPSDLPEKDGYYIILCWYENGMCFYSFGGPDDSSYEVCYRNTPFTKEELVNAHKRRGGTHIPDNDPRLTAHWLIYVKNDYYDYDSSNIEDPFGWQSIDGLKIVAWRKHQSSEEWYSNMKGVNI